MPSPITLHEDAGMDDNAEIWGSKKMLVRSRGNFDPHVNQVKPVIFIHDHQIPKYICKWKINYKSTLVCLHFHNNHQNTFSVDDEFIETYLTINFRTNCQLSSDIWDPGACPFILPPINSTIFHSCEAKSPGLFWVHSLFLPLDNSDFCPVMSEAVFVNNGHQETDDKPKTDNLRWA